jgi:hypothetical protein
VRLVTGGYYDCHRTHETVRLITRKTGYTPEEDPADDPTAPDDPLRVVVVHRLTPIRAAGAIVLEFGPGSLARLRRSRPRLPRQRHGRYRDPVQQCSRVRNMQRNIVSLQSSGGTMVPRHLHQQFHGHFGFVRAARTREHRRSLQEMADDWIGLGIAGAAVSNCGRRYPTTARACLPRPPTAVDSACHASVESALRLRGRGDGGRLTSGGFPDEVERPDFPAQAIVQSSTRSPLANRVSGDPRIADHTMGLLIYDRRL